MTPGLRYLLADVFTDRPFGGNPLAVFPAAGDLPASLMQRIAAEIGLSETVFVQAPADPANTCRLRIFTPRMELPLAGHPTLGTACLLAMEGAVPPGRQALRLEEGIGMVAVEVFGGDSRHARAMLRVDTEPEHRDASPAVALAECLALQEADIGDGRNGAAAVSCGVPFHIVPVADAATLARASLDRAAWARALAGHWAPHLYLVARLDSGQRLRFRARMFAPAMGIEEDPATGAAAAALGAWLQDRRPCRDGVLWCDIEQGVEMGRHSLIELGVPAPRHGSPGIRIGGTTVRMGEGLLDPATG